MAAATVSAKVRAAHRGRVLLVAIESSIVGLSAGIATLAAGATVRMDSRDPQASVLLVLVGILGALSWWMDRHRDAAAVARSIDRRSGWGGAVTTAFEAESAADRSAVAAVLAKRMAPVVSPLQYLARESRSSVAVLAAPLLATALLGAVTEAQMSEDDPGDLAAGPSSSAILAGSADLRARARSLAASPSVSARDVADLAALVQRADLIEPRAAALGDPRTSLADLESEFARIARRIEAAGSPASGAGVASAGRDGTMGGPDPRSEAPRDDPMREIHPPKPLTDAGDSAARGSGAEGGVGAPRWWPERYDGVVERWIEARRAPVGGRPR